MAPAIYALAVAGAACLVAWHVPVFFADRAGAQLADPLRKVPYGGIASVPFADLSLLEQDAPARETLAADFRRAFSTVGMLRLKNAGLPLELVDAAARESLNFFTLPVEQKQKYGYGQNKGSVPLGGTFPYGRRYHVQSSFEDDAGKSHIVNEWFIYRSVSSVGGWPGSRSEQEYYADPAGQLFFKKTEGSDYTFPPELPQMQGVLEQYHDAIHDVANKVMRAFALALNVSEDYFVQMSSPPEWPVTIAHYPDTKGLVVPPGTMRVNPHWDRDLFALVALPSSYEFSETNSLQVLVDSDGNGVDGRAENAEWRAVKLQRGEVLVNLGELMARYSNGRFKHVVHQVPSEMADGEGVSSSRLSLMAYVRPNYDQMVEPILPPGEEPQYKSIPVGLVASYDTEGAEQVYTDHCVREKLRLAQGMYTSSGEQGAVRFPSHTHAVHVPGCPQKV